MSEIPDPIADDTLAVYEEVKKAAAWESNLLTHYESKGKAAQPRDIRHYEGDYVPCLSFWDINELIDIEPSRGGMYIYSSSEAFDEEQRIDIRRLRRWIDHFGLSSVGVPDVKTGKPIESEQGFLSSGHASSSDLIELINTIHPEIVIPIHTEHPQLFSKPRSALTDKLSCPKQGCQLRYHFKHDRVYSLSSLRPTCYSEQSEESSGHARTSSISVPNASLPTLAC
ncbi:MAG: hypothetical protein JW732_07995 [Dehalococcoidia bacterium]|nr:hypothetical protein [Dehalococcoidia bacterium]